MVWVIVVVAIIVLALAAWAGTGRLGEMPEVVTDRPKGHAPDGAIDTAFVDAVRIPTASSGYQRSQVDQFLNGVALGERRYADEAEFDVVVGGYDMQFVDELLDRLPPRPTVDADPAQFHRPVDDDVDVIDEAADDGVDAPSAEPQDAVEDLGDESDEAASGHIDDEAAERTGATAIDADREGANPS